MYAVIKTGGKQYRVQPGDVIVVEKLDGDAGSDVSFGDVLMLGTDCLDDGSRPLAGAGDRIEIRAPGFAPLVHTLVKEDA